MPEDDLTGPALVALGDRALVLCGFMGVGKSSVGRRLGEIFGRTFIDTDQQTVALLGRSIVDLFEAGEEGLFRATEADVTARVVAERPPRVVALGGGALEDPTTRRLVADRSLLVLLEQSWADIAMALPTLRRGRPLLASRSDDEIRELFERRQSNYAAAQLRVPVDRRGIDGAVAAVLRALSTISQRQIPPSPTDGPIPDSFGP